MNDENHKTELYRNDNGNVTFHSGETVTIPSSMTMLAMLAQNPVCAGEDFRPDGYVYQNGVKVRRWFKRLPNWQDARIWPGRYDQLSQVEASLERNRQRVLKWCEKHWTEAKDRVKASNGGNPIYGWVPHRGQWVLLTPSMYRKEECIRETDLRLKEWENARDCLKGVKHDPYAARQYCEMIHHRMARQRRLGLIYCLFDSILFHRFEEPLFDGRVIRLQINGREYIFRRYPAEFSMELEWLARPGDTNIVVVNE